MNDNEPTAEDKMTRGVACCLGLCGAGVVLGAALAFLLAKWIVS